MKKKAQAATEFLVSYGWAILVVLVIISALAYFGVMNPKKEVAPAICLFSYGIACQDFKIEPSQATLYLTNGFGKDVTITNITLGNCHNAFNDIIANGDSTQFQLSSCTFGELGDAISGDIIIYYTTPENMKKTHQGTIKATIE